MFVHAGCVGCVDLGDSRVSCGGGGGVVVVVVVVGGGGGGGVDTGVRLLGVAQCIPFPVYTP